MDKIAQRRNLLNKIKKEASISGRLVEKFSPEFAKLMDSLREVDNQVREEAAEGGDENLKNLLKAARTNFNRREYANCIIYLGKFHEKLESVKNKFKKLEGDVSKAHNEFLFSELDEEQKKYLIQKMPERFKKSPAKKAAAFNELIKSAGLSDMWHNISTDRGRALKAWEKRFPKFANQFKREAERMLNRSEAMLSTTLSTLKSLASFRDNRKLEDYVKTAADFMKKYDSYDANFNQFFNGTVVKLIESQKIFEAEALKNQVPADPEEPAKSAEPAEKTKPAEPEEPVDPVEKADPAEPAKAVKNEMEELEKKLLEQVLKENAAKEAAKEEALKGPLFKAYHDDSDYLVNSKNNPLDPNKETLPNISTGRSSGPLPAVPSSIKVDNNGKKVIIDPNSTQTHSTPGPVVPGSANPGAVTKPSVVEPNIPGSVAPESIEDNEPTISGSVVPEPTEDNEHTKRDNTLIGLGPPTTLPGKITKTQSRVHDLILPPPDPEVEELEKILNPPIPRELAKTPEQEAPTKVHGRKVLKEAFLNDLINNQHENQLVLLNKIIRFANNIAQSEPETSIKLLKIAKTIMSK